MCQVSNTNSTLPIIWGVEYVNNLKNQIFHFQMIENCCNVVSINVQKTIVIKYAKSKHINDFYKFSTPFT